MNYVERDQYGIYKSNGHLALGPDQKHGPGPRLMGAETLIGNNVVNREGESLGDIKEIMLDVLTGKVSYAVLSFGGFLSIGEKLFAVPWRALTLDTENHRFVLDVSNDRLTSAPGFNTDKWPDMADQHWANEVHNYYGVKPEPWVDTIKMAPLSVPQ